MLELSAGTVIGGEYRIVRLLGAGGMGAVYLAEQSSTSQHRALKVMHPAMVQDPRLRERFEQEARVGSRIASDHVVRVIAAGVDPALSAPWIAMELLEGEDLASALRRGPLPADEVVRIFAELCHALGAAHAVGVVHRDVKPENVFLARAHTLGARTSIKVLDFGIAKLVADASPTATSNVGTPLWMAPEQTDPRAPITPAADVWALGLLAYTLVTGRYYWRSADASGTSLQALFREVLVEPLPAASARAAEHGVASRLPVGFDGWFARCVAREPGARFASAREAYDALAALPAAHTTMPSVTAVAAERSRGGWLIGAALSALVLLGVVGLAGGVAAYLYLGDEAPAPIAASPPVPPPAPEPEPAPSGPAAPVPEPEAAPAAKRSAPAAPAATTATKPGKPFDRAAAEAAMRKREAGAAAACRSNKSPDAGTESYKGTVGLKGSGAVRSMTIIGAGGARQCVHEHIRGYTVQPFDEDAVKTEIVAWSVSVP